MNNKLEFAQRLQEAMRAAGLEPRPSVLLNLFNSRYWGRSVTFQAVSRWLKGEAIPAQDKLMVLAELLRIEPSALRFGVQAQARLEARQRNWDEAAGYLERETFEAFLALPPSQRKLVGDLIRVLSGLSPETQDKGSKHGS